MVQRPGTRVSKRWWEQDGVKPGVRAVFGLGGGQRGNGGGEGIVGGSIRELNMED